LPKRRTHSGTSTTLGSGAGKTTLLDIISGRKTYGTVEGAVLLGGRKPTPAVQRHQMGYVEQFDALVSTLSVRDMLLYTSELKRPMVRASPLRPANLLRLPPSLPPSFVNS